MKFQMHNPPRLNERVLCTSFTVVMRSKLSCTSASNLYEMCVRHTSRGASTIYHHVRIRRLNTKAYVTCLRLLGMPFLPGI